MLFAGIMDILFFTSIMSMMGMTLNPMESQMAAESGGGGTDGAGETDSGGAGASEADTGGGNFGGFDGGGFGDF
jgi:hypothetical protein